VADFKATLRLLEKALADEVENREWLVGPVPNWLTKEQKSTLAEETLPLEILKRYEKWKDIAMVSGLVGLRLIKGFHDEALQGEWQGHRSSRLSLQYRVIYKVNTTDSIFQVITITPHDYRRM
jgi:proteic killer suppression protein